ncbi:hypothetical protein ACIRVF_14165 [Kitasatospora sp. NPDC101157]|uniref:phosphorylase family protein n=1 Tax=Kitasatospora sp. NPDC101157 TaxID=3364098 RepID=UPI00382D2555
MTIDRTASRGELGVIGGSGLYALLDEVTEVRVDTPYGPPGDALFLGEVAGRRVAFLPRHGRGHGLPPHRIDHRANLWALHSVGVRQVLGPCAVGGLREEYGPGTLLVHDTGVESGDGVTHAEVLEVFAGNVDRLRTVLFKALERLPAERDRVCSHAVDGVVTGLPGVGEGRAGG